MGTPTIKDVARKANVSIATISRVVNNRGGVSNYTRDRVRSAIEDTGFRPNSIGRMLKMARSKTIGVLVPTLKNPIFASLVESIQWAAEQLGYKTLLVSSGYDTQRELAAVNSLLTSRVEGLILTVADERNSKALKLLRSEHIPFVLVFNPVTKSDCSTITVDNKSASTSIVLELINRGHKNIGMVVGRVKSSDRSRLRREGYIQALKAAHISPSLVLEVAFDENDMTSVCRKLLAYSPSISAIFCSTDMLAIRIIRGFGNFSIQVPNDIAVAGFDGIETGKWITPSLATIEQPVEEMGRKAVHHLVEDRIEGNGEPLHLTLGYNIRSGDSWARVAKAPSTC